MRATLFAIVLLLSCGVLPSARAEIAVREVGHPRLYFTATELPRLRELRGRDGHREIWENLRASADWALTRTPRKQWIAPVEPDPNYENLYDRFYAIMGDLAVTEHLAFAYALSGDARYGEAARQWTLASCRAWKREADGDANGAKAYAVMRLLKGIAVGYDAAFDRFSDSERQEIRDALLSIGDKYYRSYFVTPAIAGPEFHTHHATVEWASLGVAALALAGEAPQANEWLDATITKFERHLLPSGLAADGAQVEGATFWASTMHYRIFFMDALRRVTRRDLLQDFSKVMNADLALASIAAVQEKGWSRSNQSVVHSPSYGQLDYYAPVLLFLAREYRNSTFACLAGWDRTLGEMQRTRYVTPHGEQLLFSLGGYAFVWFDPSVPANATEQRLAHHFPSTDEAYLRASWRPGDLLVGVRRGELVVHSGGEAILVEPVDRREPLDGLRVKSVQDNGAAATIACENETGEASLSVELHRPGALLIRRRVKGDWQWSCQGHPVRSANDLTWKTGSALRVVQGTMKEWEPSAGWPPLSTAFGKLVLRDPAPDHASRATITPDPQGEIVIEITRGDGS